MAGKLRLRTKWEDPPFVDRLDITKKLSQPFPDKTLRAVSE